MNFSARLAAALTPLARRWRRRWRSVRRRGEPGRSRIARARQSDRLARMERRRVRPAFLGHAVAEAHLTISSGPGAVDDVSTGRGDRRLAAGTQRDGIGNAVSGDLNGLTN